MYNAIAGCRNKRKRLTILAALTVFCLPVFVSAFAATAPVENKPTVLVVYADWCPYCQKLKPTLALINEKYHGRIRFIRFDLTSQETTARSRAEAQKLGFADFLEKNQETTSLVVIRDPAGHELFRAVHDYDPAHYETVLDQQLRAERK